MCLAGVEVLKWTLGSKNWYNMKTLKIKHVILLTLWVAMVVSAYTQKILLMAALETNPYQGSAESVARGQALWSAHCQVCHGPDGEGNGPASAQLSVKPKDLTMIALAPVFPDGIVAFRISNGKNTMPAWKQAFTPEEIWDLVSYIRSKSKKTAKT